MGVLFGGGGGGVKLVFGIRCIFQCHKYVPEYA